MPAKVLTVDDSKTVRTIVRKALRPFDCVALDAPNGMAGLMVAAKELPSLILLDVTMPVMDGVVTLTKLKADESLRPIPVVMLTAEEGHDPRLGQGRLEVFEYLAKPFNDAQLIATCGRAIALQPAKNSGRYTPATISSQAVPSESARVAAGST